MVPLLPGCGRGVCGDGFLQGFKHHFYQILSFSLCFQVLFMNSSLSVAWLEDINLDHILSDSSRQQERGVGPMAGVHRPLVTSPTNVVFRRCGACARTQARLSIPLSLSRKAWPGLPEAWLCTGTKCLSSSALHSGTASRYQIKVALRSWDPEATFTWVCWLNYGAFTQNGRTYPK